MGQVRVLGAGDEAAFKALRLRALKEHPEAFGSSYAEEVDMSPEAVRDRLTHGQPDGVTIGAFVDGELRGILAAHRIPKPKLRHVVTLGGMYVAPEARGKNLGRLLIAFVIDHCRSIGGVRIVRLAVTVGNTPARNLYRSAGFVPWGVEPGLIRVEDTFHDVEWLALYL